MGTFDPSKDRFLDVEAPARTAEELIAAAEAAGAGIIARAKSVIMAKGPFPATRLSTVIMAATEFPEQERSFERIWRKGVVRRNYVEAPTQVGALIVEQGRAEMLEHRLLPNGETPTPRELFVMEPPHRIKGQEGEYLQKITVDRDRLWLDLIRVDRLQILDHFGFLFCLAGRGEGDAPVRNPFKQVSQETHTARATASV